MSVKNVELSVGDNTNTKGNTTREETEKVKREGEKEGGREREREEGGREKLINVYVHVILTCEVTTLLKATKTNVCTNRQNATSLYSNREERERRRN